ncbi:MAG: AraC family transcriptional regulator [Bacteroidota bacterium]
MSKIAQYHLHKLHPEKLQFEVYDLRSYREKSGNHAAVPHSHSYYQIIWFFSEGGTHTVDFKTYSVNTNTILFISKDQIHAFDENLDIAGWLIHFNESFFMHTDVDVFLKYNIFKTQENPCYAMELEAISTAKTYMSLILDELKQRYRFGFEENIRFLLKSLLITLERAHQEDSTKALEFNSQHELVFFKFKELIEQYYKENITVEEYAAKLHISSKTLTTISKKIIGKSPLQLIQERIILEAKRLLKFTSLQVGEIAFKIGFEDASYFIKFFKRHESQSPRSYRKNAQDEN